MSKKIGKELREIQQLLHQRMEATRIHHSQQLTHVQVHVLLYIYKAQDKVFQKDIEKHLKVRRSTASQILNILEREEYLLRKRIEADGRMKEIVITNKTLSLIDEMDKHIEKTEKMLVKDVSSEDLKVFFSVIDQIKRNLEEVEYDT